MISGSELRPGTTFEWNNDIYMVLESNISKVAMRQAHVRLRMKNLRSGSIVNQAFTTSEKFKPAHIEKTKIQYLYNDVNFFYFMDVETFEQYQIDKNSLSWNKNFLTEGLIVDLVMYEKEILGINLPMRVSLKVIVAEDAVKGNTATNAQKRVQLSTGFEVLVPLFIKQDDEVIIDTETGKYISRG